MDQIAKNLADQIAAIVDDIGKARKGFQQELRNQVVLEDEVRPDMKLNVDELKIVDGGFEKRFNKWVLPKRRRGVLAGNVVNLKREIKEAKAMDDENRKPINRFEKADKEAGKIEVNEDAVAENAHKVDVLNANRLEELIGKGEAAFHEKMLWGENPDDLQPEIKALRERWKARINQILQMEVDLDLDKKPEDLVNPNNPILEEQDGAPHQNAFEDLGGNLNVNINNKQKDNKQMITNVTIGADPELFIFNTATKSVVSSIGLIPGEKGKPWRDKGWAKGFGLEIDNILGEFNIPPAHTKDEFIESINFMKKYIREFVKKKNPDYDIRYRASYMVPEDQLQSEEAKKFG